MSYNITDSPIPPGDSRRNTTNYEHPQETNLLSVHRAMEYDFQGQPIIRTDLSNVDVTGKNRLKTSARQTVFFNSALYDIGTDVWDYSTTLGATATHDTNINAVILTSSSTIGSTVIRQTRKVMNYISGRAAMCEFAFSVSQAVGARTRVGLFDENNGIYFEKDENSVFWCVIRSKSTGSVVENRVSRDNWNVDKLDGTGPSGITVTPGKIQLIAFEYEWFGAGNVAIGFIIDGHYHIIHTFYTANHETVSWASQPFFPVRSEITNISATTSSYLTLFSTSFSMEGESTSYGVPKITGIPLPGLNLTTAFTYVPTVSIRLKSNQLTAVAFIEQVQAFTTDNTFLTFRIIKNATLSNGGTLTWTDFSTTGSSIEVNTNATSFTGGEVIALGVVPLNGRPYELDGNTGVFQIGRTGMGTVSDVFTLALSPAKNNVIALGTLRWREQR